MSGHSQRSGRTPLQLEQMEDRCLMAGDLGYSAVSVAVAVDRPATDAVGKLDAVVASDGIADQTMGLPLLDSLPGAPRTLYLDFTGNFEADWWQNFRGHEDHYQNLVTPAFDTDGNPNAFSEREQDAIRRIWATVAEDFAPFNINVTTHYYGALDDGKALKVAIGGTDEWLQRDEGVHPSGTSEIRSFLTDAPNTVFVFSRNFGSTSLHQLQIGTTASHEAGHAFGLHHRSIWSADGKSIVNEHDPGTGEWTPIMGQNTSADRTTWSRGVTAEGPNSLQDEFAMLGGILGFRSDEQGTKTLTGGTSAAIRAPLTGGGLINTVQDVDTFEFSTSGGVVKVVVTANQVGPNLIPRAELWSSTKLLKAGTPGSTGTSVADPKLSVIEMTLAAGTYFVKVTSVGDYGDMGQYTVKVTTTLSKVAFGESARATLLADTKTNRPLVNTVQPVTSEMTSGNTNVLASSDGAPPTPSQTNSIPMSRTTEKRNLTQAIESLKKAKRLKAIDTVFAAAGSV